QNLSADAHALLAEADARELGEDPWVYDDDDDVGAGKVGDDGDAGRRRSSGRISVEVDTGRRRAGVLAEGAAAAAAAAPYGGGGPLRRLFGLPPVRGREPGSHEVHPPAPGPDPWRTADQEAVTRVLTRGSSTPVHHTLKSKLAEDAVRHMYGIAPVGATTAAASSPAGRVGPGVDAAAAEVALPFFPPSFLLTNQKAAAHEVELRRQIGFQVTPDLVAAKNIAAPKTARLVVRERTPPASEMVITKAMEAADGSLTFTSRYGFRIPPSPSTTPSPATRAGDTRHRPSSAASTSLARSHTSRVRFPEGGRVEAVPPSVGAGTTLDERAHVRPHRAPLLPFHGAPNKTQQLQPPSDRRVPSFARSTSATRAHGMVQMGTVLQGEWGDPALQRSVGDVLRYLDGKWIPREEGKGEEDEEGEAEEGRRGDSTKKRSGGSPPKGNGRRPSAPRGRARSASSTRSQDHHHHQQQQRQHGRYSGRHIYGLQNGELVYAGRRPPFVTVFPPPYEVPPQKFRPMGHAYSKEDAERLAGAVSNGARGNTELHWAAGRGDAPRVAELLLLERSWEGPAGTATVAAPVATAVVINSRNAAGETPLHRAAQCVGASSVAAMELLLAEGADPNAADCHGATPLMCVLTSGSWLPEGDLRCKVLLRGGARVDVRDSAGETLLHKAISYNVCRDHPPHKRPPTAHRSPCRTRQTSPYRQNHRDGTAAVTSHGPGTTSLAELLQLLLLLLSRERLPPYPGDDEYDDARRGLADRVAAVHRGGTTKRGAESVSHGLALAAGARSSGSFVASVVAAAAAA
ncbi:hypothetical protein VaNZ11_002726, partial [Volvox africanus]